MNADEWVALVKFGVATVGLCGLFFGICCLDELIGRRGQK